MPTLPGPWPGWTEPLEVLTPIALRLPLAPGVAAAQEGVEVDLGRIAAGLKDLAARYEFLVVEGAGGLYVPLVGTHFLVLDLIRWLGLPLAVVAKSGLGTINHTVLTVKAAQAAGIEVAGVILNRYPENPGLAAATNPGVIEALTGVPILGRLPEVADLDRPADREIFLAALAPIAERLADFSGRGLWAEGVPIPLGQGIERRLSPNPHKGGWLAEFRSRF